MTTAIEKGDTLKMREAINQAILHSRINKPTEILEEVDELVLDYGRRLKSFNFGSSMLQKEEQKHTQIQTTIKQNKLIKDVNSYYMEKYQNHTIIPLSDLTKILKKYDLFSGNTEYYNKLIPQKNLIEMEEFWKNSDHNPFGVFDLNNLSELEVRDIASIDCVKEERGTWGEPKKLYAKKSDLQIIAPLDEFTLSSTEKVIGNFIVHDYEWDEKNVKIPQPLNLDPIVWIPIKYPAYGGAALIITQWGPEADLPEFN